MLHPWLGAWTWLRALGTALLTVPAYGPVKCHATDPSSLPAAFLLSTPLPAAYARRACVAQRDLHREPAQNHALYSSTR